MKKVYDELLGLFENLYGEQDPNELSKEIKIDEPMVHSSPQGSKKASGKYIRESSFKEKPFKVDIDENGDTRRVI